MSGVTLFLVGDVMPGRGIDQLLPHSCSPGLYEPSVTSALDYVTLAERAHGPISRPLGYGDIWGEAREVLARELPDARIVNLETSVTTSEDAEPKGINYRMHPSNIPVLTELGIDCCVLANNHVLDWGDAGLLETLEVLARAGIRVAGAGSDLREASEPVVLQTSAGARVLVFAFGTYDSGIPREWAAGDTTPGVHLIDDLSPETVARITRLVGTTKRPSDLAVASIHWGRNWSLDIPAAQRRFAHALIDSAGIDVVHGHSSHHPKAVEIYRGRPIIYGCGDFLNDYEGIPGHKDFRADLVLMYFPAFAAGTGQLVRLRMAPLQIRGCRLGRPSPADFAWLRDRLDRECGRFGHHVRVEDDVFVLEWV